MKDKALISGQIDMTSTIEEDIKVLKNKLKKHGTGLDACNCTSCYNSRMRLPILERWLATSKAKDNRIRDLEAELDGLKSDRDALKQAYNEVSKMDTDKAELLLDQKGDIGKLQKRIKELEAENERLKKRLEVRI
jgi:predicted  nucleic acid-binding Zn-ribbon protein